MRDILKPRAIIIAGPTAVGKTEYAVETAERIGGEIVSADSMQIYRYMDIGSAKPTSEELSRAKHHLVDEVDPREEFSVFSYQKRAREIIADIVRRGKTPIISGGTGLYINSIIYDMDFSEAAGNWEFRESLSREAEKFGNDYIHEKLKELDPAAAERIHPNNVKKVIRAIEIAQNTKTAVRSFEESFVPNEEYDFKLIGLTRDRAELYERIHRRVDILISPREVTKDNGKTVQWGLADEVKSLIAMGLTVENIAMKGIGYKEIIGFLNGEYDLEYASDLIKKNTRHYAKRQLTWFRRYDQMNWINLSDYQTKEEAVEKIMQMR